MAASLSWNRSLSHWAPSSSKPVSGPCGRDLVEEQPERDAHQGQREREQQHPQLVAPERAEFGRDAIGQQVLHGGTRSSSGGSANVDRRPLRVRRARGRCGRRSAAWRVLAGPVAVPGARRRARPAPTDQGGLPLRGLPHAACGDLAVPVVVAGRAAAAARRRVGLLRPGPRLRRTTSADAELPGVAGRVLPKERIDDLRDLLEREGHAGRVPRPAGRLPVVADGGGRRRSSGVSWRAFVVADTAGALTVAGLALGARVRCSARPTRTPGPG